MNATTSIIDIILNAPATTEGPTVTAPPMLDNQKEETPAKPPMYAVLLHNDPSTHFHFVVRVLNEVFNINQQRATQIMMAAHTNGKASVVILDKDTAETKVGQAMALVKSEGSGMNGLNPEASCELTFTAEPESDEE